MGAAIQVLCYGIFWIMMVLGVLAAFIYVLLGLWSLPGFVRKSWRRDWHLISAYSLLFLFFLFCSIFACLSR